jgi:ubiquinone/menaquinone biosynthesis C-methylase UbiE
MADYQALKDDLIGQLSGTVLEIGAGRGRNFARLNRDARWIGLEPSAKRRAQLWSAAQAYGHRDPVLTGSAESIPLADRSVDAVFGTVVLCSVSNTAKVLAEVRRVLKSGGKFVFFEHVAAPAGTVTFALQRVWGPISVAFGGCHLERDTWRELAEAGFATVSSRWFVPSAPWSIHGRYLAGHATVS